LVYPLGSDETGDEMQMISCSLKGNLLTDQGTGVIAFPEEKVSGWIGSSCISSRTVGTPDDKMPRKPSPGGAALPLYSRRNIYTQRGAMSQ
jgi:hypothetical protein